MTKGMIIDHGRLRVYTGTDTEVAVPEGVTSVLPGAFRNRKALKRVVLPDSISYIGEGAFRGCSVLESIRLPALLKELDNDVFSDCGSLQEIELPDGLTRISDGAFKGCGALARAVLPDSVTEIGNSAFRDCAALQEIELPDGIEELRSCVFNGCRALVRVKLPRRLRRVGDYAFSECIALTEIRFPDFTVRLGQGAFNGCSSLRRVELPRALNSIKGDSFYGCGALTGIELPEGVTEIGDRAFKDCVSLAYIRFSKALERIGEEAFYFCKRLREVRLPERVGYIGDYAFGKCAMLETVELPDPLREVGDLIFYDSKAIRTLYLPAGVRLKGFCGATHMILAPDWEELPPLSRDGMWRVREITISEPIGYACPEDAEMLEAVHAEQIDMVPEVLRPAATVGFARDRRFFTEDDGYEAYVRENGKLLIALAEKQPELVQLLCTCRLVDECSFERITEAVQSAGDPELMATLLSYRADVLSDERLDRLEAERQRVADRLLDRPGGDSLSGLRVCLAGSPEGFPDGTLLRSMLEREGATLVGGVSATTDLLIADEAGARSGKGRKAETLGIEVIEPMEFLKRYHTLMEIRNGRLITCISYEDEVTIPADVTSIAKDAFGRYGDFTRVIIVPATVTEFENDALIGSRYMLVVTKGSAAEAYARKRQIYFQYAE